jgi:hypothetical protein
MLQNFKYFDWGGGDGHATVYGLYLSVTDCFLLVIDNLDQAIALKTVLSSRYELLIVEISSADNFAPNLIDNSVCTHWSFENKSQVVLGDISFFKKHSAQHLYETQPNTTVDLESEQRYAMMCRHWINFLSCQKFNLWDSQRNLHFLHLPQLESNQFQQAVDDIYLALYLGQDWEQVDNHIIDLIQHSDMIWQPYNFEKQ